MNHEKPEAGARAPPVAATAARRLPGVQPPDYSDGDNHNHHCDRKDYDQDFQDQDHASENRAYMMHLVGFLLRNLLIVMTFG